MEAQIRIFTFREGLLSKLAHDLELAVARFVITLRGRQVDAKIDPASVCVLGAMKDGRLVPGELSDGDKEKIHDNMKKDVLHTREHPDARFVGTVEGQTAPYRISGSLTLLGRSNPFAVTLSEQGGRLVGSSEIVPSQWGVKPFRALGGTLKVQDRVRIQVEVDATAIADTHNLDAPTEITILPR